MSTITVCEMELFYISEKGHPEKIPNIYQEAELSYNSANRTWRAEKEKDLTQKKLLIICEMGLSSPKLKKRFIF